jgi:hypothetical protein
VAEAALDESRERSTRSFVSDYVRIGKLIPAAIVVQRAWRELHRSNRIQRAVVERRRILRSNFGPWRELVRAETLGRRALSRRTVRRWALCTDESDSLFTELARILPVAPFGVSPGYLVWRRGLEAHRRGHTTDTRVQVLEA